MQNTYLYVGDYYYFYHSEVIKMVTFRYNLNAQWKWLDIFFILNEDKNLLK